MVRPAVKRDAVAHLQAKLGLSERRASRLVGADRKMIRYQSRRPPEHDLDPVAPLVAPFVVFHGRLSRFATRDAGLYLLVFQCISEPVGVITTIYN